MQDAHKPLVGSGKALRTPEIDDGKAEAMLEAHPMHSKHEILCSGILN